MLNINFLIKGNIEQLNKNCLITLIKTCVKDMGTAIRFSEWGGNLPVIQFLKENMYIFLISEEVVRIMPNPDVPLAYYEIHFEDFNRKQLLTVVRAIRDHVTFLRQKDDMLNLPDNRRVALMIALYYSLTAESKDEFLRETENS